MESFMYSRYVVRVDQESKIAPGYVHQIVCGFSCPRCQTVNKPSLEHGQKRRCSKCGLKMERLGNSLKVSA